MRKFVKNQILDIFGTLYEAHDSVRKLVEKKDTDNVVTLLGDCQNTAVQIGDIIDSSEGEGSPVIHLLEDYCEAVYQVSVGLSENITGIKAKKLLDKNLVKAENGVKNDIKIKLEVVFMPYKASMWDSLESVWKAADEDPDCDAYVVPIPYYDRNPDHSFGKYHYEGCDYPKYVPVVHYDSYDLAARHPDVIYIHNPYDANNYVTSVDPRFYSGELKKYTGCLAYIDYGVPLHVFKEPVPFDQYSYVLESWFRFDLYFVFSKIYANNIQFAMNCSGQKTNTKVIPIGSPKFDKIINTKKSDYVLPKEWEELVRGKKIILFNTSLSVMLKNVEGYLLRLKEVLSIFKNNNDIILWWRPHPLIQTTLKSMRSDYYNIFNEILNNYSTEKWGILDTSNDVTRAIICTDAYYGDTSSLVYLYCATGKPFTIIDFPYDNYMFTENTETFDKCLEWRINNMKKAPGANIDNYNNMIWWSNFYEDLNYKKFLKLFLDYVINRDKYPQANEYHDLQVKLYQEFVENYDGTAGARIYEYSKTTTMKESDRRDQV